MGLKFSPPPQASRRWGRTFTRHGQQIVLGLSVGTAVLMAALSTLVAYLLIVWPLGALIEVLVRAWHLNTSAQATTTYETVSVLAVSGLIGGIAGGLVWWWMCARFLPPHRPLRPESARLTVGSAAVLWTVLVVVLAYATR